MSILLDALKKAEARKRLEAAQDGTPAAFAPVAPTPAAPSGMSLEPMTEATPAAVGDVSADTAPAPAPTFAPTPTLELAPVEPRAPEPTSSNEPSRSSDAPSAAMDDTTTASATTRAMDTGFKARVPAVDTHAEIARSNDTPTTVSTVISPPISIATPRAAVAATSASASAIARPAPSADASRSAAPAFRAPTDKPGSEQAATNPSASDKPGPHKPTNDKPAADTCAPAADNDAARRQAQTVLSAPRAKTASSSRSRWVYASAGVGLLVLLGSGAVFLRQLGVPPFGTPTSLVSNLPPPSSEPITAPIAEAQPAATNTDSESGIDTGIETALVSDGGSDAPPASVAASPATAVDTPRVEPAAMVAPAAIVAPADNDHLAIADAPAPPTRSALATPVDELQLRREPLRVQRRSAPSQLNAAYASLQAGRLDAAETAYRSALDAQPGELDALLGLAVIAERRGDRASADRYYRRVLTQQPDHPQAMASLLSANGPPQGEDEQRLRQSLAEHPDSAVLHAAMGQRMATQQRWADAQAAYFEAVAREPGNADHLYNLAVALDHLQQPRMAADYYRRALAQPDPSSRFGRQAAMQRLAALDAAGASR